MHSLVLWRDGAQGISFLLCGPAKMRARAAAAPALGRRPPAEQRGLAFAAVAGRFAPELTRDCLAQVRGQLAKLQPEAAVPVAHGCLSDPPHVEPALRRHLPLGRADDPRGAPAMQSS
jgi:hypothetical protein